MGGGRREGERKRERVEGEREGETASLFSHIVGQIKIEQISYLLDSVPQPYSGS
jgi:hypothetical protein